MKKQNKTKQVVRRTRASATLGSETEHEKYTNQDQPPQEPVANLTRDTPLTEAKQKSLGKNGQRLSKNKLLLLNTIKCY